jgi:hypothetical protein
MTISEYKLTSPKIKGEIVLTYHKRYLHSVLFKIQEPLTSQQMDWLCRNLPFAYYELEDRVIMGGIMLERITPVATTPAMEKVRMFQEHYLKHIGIAYVKQAKDHLLIAKKEVNEKLLTTYFTSTNVSFKNHHSIGNFCKFYQVLCAESSGAYSEKKKPFPDYYSKQFENKLSPQELPGYWQHLRGLGLEPKKDRFHNTIDWIPTNAKTPTANQTPE